MDQAQQDLLLQYVTAAWKALPKQRQPPCLWVHLHEPVEALAVGFKTPLLAAWFLDAKGLHRRNPWEFIRFWVVHLDKPWCMRMDGEINRLFGHPHEIGLAGFAQYQATEEFYLEVSWGGLDGRGLVLMMENGKLKEAKDVWVS